MKDKIPCKECLVRAICQEKETIECDLIDKWMDDPEGTYWLLKEVFPQMATFNWKYEPPSDTKYSRYDVELYKKENGIHEL